MVNTPSVTSPSTPAEAAKQPEECPPDNKLPENSQENLDARLDHAIEETFPTSDPISVTVTKQPAPQEPRGAPSTGSSNQSRDGQDQSEEKTAEKVLDQVKETLQDVAQTAATTARDAYSEGQRYVRQACERFPEAERSFHEGRQVLHQGITDNPWLSLLAAGAVGYLLAWMIHGQPSGGDRQVPDHARTRRGYAAHRDHQQG
ncbi:DUF883 family protein [Microvirga calopogonii]|uniref:DUF883 family protein n=1 Tax=Microvirga calopogonii TaxID=2078013 RepID=UPI000E0CEC23|nr:hypothetical protein [Microvirga calopogonii]